MWTFASALLLPLVVEGQYMPIGGGGCAPPAAESPCLHSCGATSFDLSGFKSQMTGQYFHAKDDQQHDYFFVPCGAIKSPAAQCPSQPQVPSPVAVQYWGGQTPPPTPLPDDDTCAALGTVTSGQCSKNGTSLECSYTGGGQGRSVTFVYQCSQSAGAQPTASQPDPSGMHYVITFSGPAACAMAGGGTGSKGLSWGSLFLILFPVSVVVYLSAGCYYNYKYHEKRGIEMVPQLEYWKQVPGLVYDGCVFSYQQTRAFITWVREKNAPADPTLKQALAESEDGGSTSYEEQTNKA